jgi:gliding motility-associated-like protein
VFAERGTYNVKLIAMYDNGCVDSISKPIQVYQPYAEFQTDTTMGCSPFKVEFTDESMPDTHPIDQFIWQFGDDTDTSYSVRSAPFDHWYSQPGEYLTILTVIDTLGCTASKETNIYTANPDATFSSIGNTYICAGSDITLTYGYSGADSVLWDFGDGSTSGSLDRPITRSYNDGGTFPVSLIIYKYGCIDTSTIDDLVKVQDADAYFEVSDSVVNCYPAEITFHHDSSGIDIIDGSWAYGYTDQVVPGYASDRVFTYPSPGTYPVTLEITTSFGCTNSHTRDIVVSGPSGAMEVSPATACISTPITFRLKDTANLYDYEWILGDGNSVTASPYVHKYDKVGKIYYSLVLYGDSGRCVAPPLEDSIMIHELKAVFENEDTLVCEQEQLTFTNQSIGATSLQWNFGNGNTSSATNGEQTFTAGNYQVNLVVWNDIGCQDTFSQDIVVRPAPPITTRGDTLICYGGSALLYAAGGDEVEWTPTTGLNNPLSYSPFASPKSTTIYTATVKDKTTGCTSSANVNIEVQPPPPYSIIPVDTTVIIGEMVEIHVETDENVTISWTPDNDISCIDCTVPLVRPLESRIYTVTIKDNNGCFTIVEDVNINIKEAYSVDVPTMFTPNADGNNDVVYVRGWGIKELIEFKIYNRWGNEVFSTSDITKGWDGKVNGNDQPMDTYVYVVSIETYSGEIMSKKGNITLLR